MDPPSPFPSNIHISNHPCSRAKLSILLSNLTNQHEIKRLIHEISTILACEALSSSLTLVDPSNDSPVSSLPYHANKTVYPCRIALIPILRSGLAMVDAIESVLPVSCSIHHLGLYREKTTLQPVEYYNNLPYAPQTLNSPLSHSTVHSPSPSSPSASTRLLTCSLHQTSLHTKHSESETVRNDKPSSSQPQPPPLPQLAILLDPVISSGQTMCAAIDTLRESGLPKLLVLSLIATPVGLRRAAEQWPDSVDIWVASVTQDSSSSLPSTSSQPLFHALSLGDIGDRLFGTRNHSN